MKSERNERMDFNLIRLWNRRDKKLYFVSDYNFDRESGREYWKHRGSSLWLENGIALDVFHILPNTKALKPYIYRRKTSRYRIYRNFDNEGMLQGASIKHNNRKK